MDTFLHNNLSNCISYLQLCELSFHKTRHLRNPYNENLPVKVLSFPILLSIFLPFIRAVFLHSCFTLAAPFFSCCWWFLYTKIVTWRPFHVEYTRDWIHLDVDVILIKLLLNPPFPIAALWILPDFLGNALSVTWHTAWLFRVAFLHHPLSRES